MMKLYIKTRIEFRSITDEVKLMIERLKRALDTREKGEFAVQIEDYNDPRTFISCSTTACGRWMY